MKIGIATINSKPITKCSLGFHDVLSGMALGSGKSAEGDMQIERVYHDMLVAARGGAV
jgi:hypothetical protein